MKSIENFHQNFKSGEKISMVTCYDYWSAKIIADTDIDAVLVGDSAAMVMHGFETTINADIDMMVFHTAAVSRGIKNKFIIADIPFLAHRKGRKQLIDTVDTLYKAGAQAIKLEGAYKLLDDIEFLVKSGIPVMGHLGMTPQSVHNFGGFKLQGKNKADSEKILETAIHLQDAGCFSIVLEMIPEKLAKKITETLKIPTIGIGAGSYTSGQILVLQDLLGFNKDFNPKFLRNYLNGYTMINNALNDFNNDVKCKNFPSKSESY